MVHEGRLYLPGQKPEEAALTLTVSRSENADMQIADRGSETTETAEESIPGKEEGTEANAFAGEPDTLSNEYINEMIADRQKWLQKCWVARLSENPKLKGRLVLQFEITRRGKVRDAQVAESTIKDEVLQSCVVQVMERIPFRSFKGPEISLSYPINFE